MNYSPLRISYLAFILLNIFFPILVGSRLEIPNTSSIKKSIVKAIPQISKSSTPISIVPENFNQQQITNSLQSSRDKISLPQLSTDEIICQTGEYIFDKYLISSQVDKEDINSFCPTCDKKAFITMDGNYNVDGEESWMSQDEITSYISQDFTHLCVYQQDAKVLILLGNIKPNKVSIPNTPIKTIQPPVTANFSESELWQALVDYRHTHTKPDLQKSENLCIYARKRVAEHIEQFQNKPQSEYIDQDKYPLDAHEGFMRDADSGYVFEVTGFNVVAENLAYWPTAAYPNQVIEWGWDTSTEGHREAQLSSEYSHACLSGGDGFYVAIFARN